jgi:hypothetical protein
MAMEQPVQIKAIDSPSILQMNFSFNMIGVKIAVIMMQKQEVEAIKIRLPNFSASTLNTCAKMTVKPPPQ